LGKREKESWDEKKAVFKNIAKSRKKREKLAGDLICSVLGGRSFLVLCGSSNIKKKKEKRTRTKTNIDLNVYTKEPIGEQRSATIDKALTLVRKSQTFH